jgi:hypothetical protein
MGGDCEGIDQFMSKIDNFIENQICWYYHIYTYTQVVKDLWDIY